ncbi:MAG: PRC-barrel domain-containing protein [Alphaproteobacteria bacterium]|nr:PRC-barrel domain-containing protein [Alphaproteobacteria bacterium]
MIKQALAALLTITLGFALAGESLAAETSVAPKMYNGFPNRPPERSVVRPPEMPAVSPTADQIEASKVIGADIKNANDTTIAKITDVIIDRRLGTAAVAVIAPAAGAKPFDKGKKSAVAWTSLQFEPRPLPHFATKLDQKALDASTALVERAKTGDSYFDVKRDLLGKSVVGPNGDQLGHVQNVVLNFTTGRVVALVISTGGFINMGGAHNHAVAWDAAKPQPGQNGGAVRVAVTKAQVDGAPVMATMAPAPIGPPPNQNAEIRHDATGNISGSKIPATQDRR